MVESLLTDIGEFRLNGCSGGIIIDQGTGICFLTKVFNFIRILSFSVIFVVNSMLHGLRLNILNKATNIIDFIGNVKLIFYNIPT